MRKTKQLFLHPQANTEAFYKARRAEFNRSKDIFRRSVIFLYLNRFGYNGLCRYARKKGTMFPLGVIKPIYFPEKNYVFVEKAQRQLCVCGFEQVFELAKIN